MAGKSKARKYLVVPHYARTSRYGNFAKVGDIFISRSQKPEGYIMFQKNGSRGETLMRMTIEDFNLFLEFAQEEVNANTFETLLGVGE